jgi:hypothetical protein
MEFMVMFQILKLAELGFGEELKFHNIWKITQLSNIWTSQNLIHQIQLIEYFLKNIGFVKQKMNKKYKEEQQELYIISDETY